MARVASTQVSVTKAKKQKIRWEVWHNPEKRRYETRLWDAENEGTVIGTTVYDGYTTSEDAAYQHEADRVAAAKRLVDKGY